MDPMGSQPWPPILVLLGWIGLIAIPLIGKYGSNPFRRRKRK